MIDDEHRLWCAGSNGGGQLARDTPSHLAPARVPGEWTDLGLGDDSQAGSEVVATDPDHRGRGIAGLLLQRAIAESIASPAEYLLLFGEAGFARTPINKLPREH